MRVLVVDDHAEIQDLLVRSLERDGHRVDSAHSLEDARRAFARNPADVIVLDVGLPDGSGFELCRELRAQRERVPILLLTAHGEIRRRVEGLDAGADDFLPKPFAVAELRARVRALGRRGALPPSLSHHVGDVELAISERRARRSARDVPLTAREWAVLELLVARRGRMVGRADILDAIWGDVEEAANASLDVIIARIRRKLGPNMIRTLRGEGYAIGEE